MIGWAPGSLRPLPKPYLRNRPYISPDLFALVVIGGERRAILFMQPDRLRLNLMYGNQARFQFRVGKGFIGFTGIGRSSDEPLNRGEVFLKFPLPMLKRTGLTCRSGNRRARSFCTLK